MDFFSQYFIRLTLQVSNLYASSKPKTLTSDFELSLSSLCLGSCRFPFLSLFLKPLPYKPSPFTHSLLLCSLFTDFSVFSGNLYDFTLNFLLFFIKNIYRLHQTVELELCFRKLGFVFFFFYLLFFEIFDQNHIKLIFFFFIKPRVRFD